MIGELIRKKISGQIVMTYKECYDWAVAVLTSTGIEDAKVDAWYLMEYVTGMNRTSYFLRMMEEMTLEEAEKYRAVIETRKTHIPLQHITGCQEFMGLSFEVNEHVLVPRQDTEVLVEQVLRDVTAGMRVLDMCTGSGCIAISLGVFRKELSLTGVDISDKALEVAKRNANRFGINVEWIESDLFSQVSNVYDVIVSNPPYIRTTVIEELKEEVKLHDPYIALDGKEDGLYFYRKIVEECPNHLKNGGKLFFEIGHDQGTDVQRLMEETGFKNVTVKKDLAGLDRVVFGVYNV